MNIKELDLRNDKCPINYLKAKWQLIQNNDISLKLIFADEKISQNVKMSLEKDGFTVSPLQKENNSVFFYVHHNHKK